MTDTFLKQTKVTISMPCFGRPQRTIRAINGVLNQGYNDWEALIIGDGCPDFKKIMDERGVEFQDRAISQGCHLAMNNLEKNYGGHGYHIQNLNIPAAAGQYFVFTANDDILAPDHLEHYLSEIDGTDYDFVYYQCRLPGNQGNRNPELRYGGIGHSELIIRTEFLKGMPAHSAEYGHDWHLVDAMMKAGAKHKKAVSTKATYYIMGTPACREEGID